jgi:hypothetical protein
MVDFSKLSDNDIAITGDILHNADNINRKSFLTSIEAKEHIIAHTWKDIIEEEKKRIEEASYYNEDTGEKYVDMKKLKRISMAECFDILATNKEYISLSINGRSTKAFAEIITHNLQIKEYKKDDKGSNKLEIE